VLPTDCGQRLTELAPQPLVHMQAITYSAMQIMEKPEGERSEVFVIIDI
jgi:hypothetical protein